MTFVQLPIPPLGPDPIIGNVPLAAGYLKMFAQNRGLEDSFDISIFPATLANTLGDRGIVEAILALDPWMVGFSCYLWNIDRTLWIAERLKERRPDLLILLGGPEISWDNQWVLDHPVVDLAVVGEGEQTFAELLQRMRDSEPLTDVPGLHVAPRLRRGGGIKAANQLLAIMTTGKPPSRAPLKELDEISSPYLSGILDAADDNMMFLETLRGCVFKCKFCYYPKAYDGLAFISNEKILENLRHAQTRKVDEVVLLDPTLNQRKDFASFVRLLAEGNPDRRFKYFGELRAEGITSEIAGLLADANFREVEIGLQSIDPHAQKLMDRTNNMKAFLKGADAMRDAGINVKVDLIIGLPGDTETTVREGFRYLKSTGLCEDVQVFNLSILPGTEFREEAKELGLTFQPRPPYYVHQTRDLTGEQMYGLIEEAQDIFEMELDPCPPPVLDFETSNIWHAGAGELFSLVRCLKIDLDVDPTPALPAAESFAQALTLWFTSAQLSAHEENIRTICRKVLQQNPFATLQIVLAPVGNATEITEELLEAILRVCQERPTYLDRFYSLQPGRPIGAKRTVIALSPQSKSAPSKWKRKVSQLASFAYLSQMSNSDSPSHNSGFAGQTLPVA